MGSDQVSSNNINKRFNERYFSRRFQNLITCSETDHLFRSSGRPAGQFAPASNGAGAKRSLGTSIGLSQLPVDESLQRFVNGNQPALRQVTNLL